MTKDEALKMALEALETKGEHHPRVYQAITAIKEVLAQPEQEPVAWAYVNSDDECEQIEYCTESPMPEFVPLFTSPPKRKPLTEFQLDPIWRETCPDEHFCSQYFDFAKAIEAAHGIGDKT